MALRLRYLAETTVPIEIEGLTPTAVRGKSLAEIERFEIFHGNRRLPLAEFFQISGDPSDLRFDFEGDLSSVHWIGAHLEQGAIHIHGSAGRHVGSQMRGGTIFVEGDAGDMLGAEMRGGRIHVRGSAGHLTGAAYRGSARGMTGGTLLVEGNVGNEVGHSMRRGLIAVGGAAGDLAGFNMIAGTVLVFGHCGIRPAAGMRRGTVALLGKQRPALLPTFRRACSYRPQALTLLLRQLRQYGFPFDDSLLTAHYELFHGDLLTVGRGEVLLRQPAA